MKELINMTFIMILLGICAYFDFKEKKIPVIPMILVAIASIGISLYQGDFSIKSCLPGLLLGAGFCILSVFSKGALGMGDGCLAVVCGICLGFYQTLALFFYGFLLTGLVGLFFLIGKKKSRKFQMPLVPFLYVAYGGMCCFRL